MDRVLSLLEQDDVSVVKDLSGDLKAALFLASRENAPKVPLKMMTTLFSFCVADFFLRIIFLFLFLLLLFLIPLHLSPLPIASTLCPLNPESNFFKMLFADFRCWAKSWEMPRSGASCWMKRTGSD
jgi:hypothetical protein